MVERRETGVNGEDASLETAEQRLVDPQAQRDARVYLAKMVPAAPNRRASTASLRTVAMRGEPPSAA